jgi:hypothetical protein
VGTNVVLFVIQTSLIEAIDEETAAQKGDDLLRSGTPVAVAVKSDDTTIRRIVVAAKPGEKVRALATATEVADQPGPGSNVTIDRTPTSRKLLLKRMIADGLTLLGLRP